MKFAWKRLVRFVGPDGQTHYGEPDIDGLEDLHKHLDAGTLNAKCVKVDIFSETAKLDGESVKVVRLLGPLSCKDVPQVKGIGLNYVAQSRCFPVVLIQSAPTANAEP